MAKSILDRLPSEMAFLKPCIQEMVKLRKGYRFPGDADECPEQARDAEMEHFHTRDMRIISKWLRNEFPSRSSLEFSARVSKFTWVLNNWLKTQKYQDGNKEFELLFGFVGWLVNPYPYFKLSNRKKRKLK